MNLSKILLGAALFAPGMAVAQDGLGKFSSSVAVTSDYIFRGYSQTDENPAFQPALNWESGTGFHLNFWGSNVDFNDGGQADVEVDITAGFSGAVDNVSYDAGVIYYAYPGARNALNYNYWEGYTTLGYDAGVAKLNGSVYFSPDFFGGLDDAWAVQVGASAPVMESLTFDAFVGTQELKKASGSDYMYWSAGLTYAFPIVDVGIRYHDTDVATCAGLCGARAVLTLSKAF
ncbi:MAG: TorF family putative porin [Rhodospirillaceae bacterium]|nr:TorF family putative porin [Rhodospirillaceae bacterium]